MNNPSLLVPQGSFADQKNKGRAKVKIAVFFVLAVHGIGLLALLMQGCRREDPNTFADPATNDLTTASSLTDATQQTQPTFEPTNVPMLDSNTLAASGAGSLTTTSGLPTGAEPTPLPTDTTPATETTALMGTAPTTEYKVVKGDSFYTIARKFHTTSKAIQDANPGVDPNKLQIAQPLQIPPPTPVSTAAPAPSAGSQQTYKVVSGDNLTRIATKFGTTVKALRNANGLKSDSIKVGQVLNIPVKTPATAPTFDSVPAPAPVPGQ